MRFGFSRLVVFALALGAALSPSRPARACWCDLPGSDAGAINVSDVAFLGIVRGVRTTGRAETATFDVLTPYKATSKGARVEVAGTGTGCDQHFQVGQRWSVFARRRGGRLETSLCDGTHPE